MIAAALPNSCAALPKAFRVKSARSVICLCVVSCAVAAFSSRPLVAQEAGDVATSPETTKTEKDDGGGIFGAMKRFEERVDGVAKVAAEGMAAVLFFDLSTPFLREGKTPWGLSAIVAYLIAAAAFFTIWTRFLNIRAFKHAFLVTAGKYDDPADPGEVNHFQALSAALSATVGLGNIAGVAVAVAIGGPGATFWLIVAGFLGMSSKFMECTLGQKYREVRPDGRIMGGGMYYLSKGLKELGLGPVGPAMGVLFAILCIGASFGGGNAFQVNQSMNAVSVQIPVLKEAPWIYGAVMAFITGLVILGGIRRIAKVAEAIVPLMCGLHVLVCLYIIFRNAPEIPAAFRTIATGAFAPDAAYGGFVGVLIQGFRRAAFSNEAGVGSAAIAHSAAKTDYPVREGIVALLEPFVDTVVVCTMTALVIVVTGVYNDSDPEIQGFIANKQGAALTAAGMAREGAIFPYLLSATTFLFAYSTMISWSYYGERCWAYLFGDRSSVVYRLLFLLVAFLGSMVSATHVIDLSDMMLFAMAVPNVIGMVLLAPGVRRDLNEYWRLYKSGAFDRPAYTTPEENAI